MELRDLKYKKYRRTNIAEMIPYGSTLSWGESISISEVDLKNGSPKKGDMIARNPKNHEDKWLVAEKYFKDNFEDTEGIRSYSWDELYSLRRFVEAQRSLIVKNHEESKIATEMMCLAFTANTLTDVLNEMTTMLEKIN